MSSDDDGVYESAANRRRRLRRTGIGAAVVGLAALLGGGAYAITTEIIDRNDSVTGDVAALAPVITPSRARPSAPEPAPQSPVPRSPAASTKAAARQSLSPPPSPSPSRSLSVREQIEAARQAAEKDGFPLQRALTAAPGLPTGKISERNEKTATGTVRVVSAGFDLTGQREFLWAGDKGRKVGDARCTQKVRFSNNKSAAVRPNLMLCWRTSATRSVATVLVDYKGHPSATESVAILDREWRRLR